MRTACRSASRTTTGLSRLYAKRSLAGAKAFRSAATQRFGFATGHVTGLHPSLPDLSAQICAEWVQCATRQNK